MNKKTIAFLIVSMTILLPVSVLATDVVEQDYAPTQVIQNPINLNGVFNFFKKNISVLSAPGGLNILPVSDRKISLGQGGGVNLDQILNFAMKVVGLLYNTGVYFFSGVFKLLGLDSLWRSIANMIQLPK